MLLSSRALAYLLRGPEFHPQELTMPHKRNEERALGALHSTDQPHCETALLTPHERSQAVFSEQKMGLSF